MNNVETTQHDEAEDDKQTSQQIKNWENLERLRRPVHTATKREGCYELVVVELDGFGLLEGISKQKNLYQLKRNANLTLSSNDLKDKKSTNDVVHGDDVDGRDDIRREYEKKRIIDLHAVKDNKFNISLEKNNSNSSSYSNTTSSSSNNSNNNNLGSAIYEKTTSMNKGTQFYDTTIKVTSSPPFSTYLSKHRHSPHPKNLDSDAVALQDRPHQSYHFPWRHLPISNLLKNPSSSSSHSNHVYSSSLSHESHLNNRLEQIFNAWRNKSLSKF